MDINKIQYQLNTQFIGKKILYFERIDSTNNFLKNLEKHNYTDGLVVIAEEQFKGRGRYNRIWYTQPKKNLTFSILLTSQNLNFEITPLPIITASAICIAIENITNIHINTKWPNDLVLNNKKLGGILIETSFDNELLKLIIGIGINVNQTHFDKEIEYTATSLYLETGKEYDRESLLSQILNSLDKMYNKLIYNDYSYYIDDWKKRCNHFGKSITFDYNGKKYKGVALGLSDNGCLIVNSNNQEMKILSGEIIINNEG